MEELPNGSGCRAHGRILLVHDLVPPTVRHCVERAVTGITLGTADREQQVHDVAPLEARTGHQCPQEAGRTAPADPLPAHPTEEWR
jgi:hypothetical protein